MWYEADCGYRLYVLCQHDYCEIKSSTEIILQYIFSKYVFNFALQIEFWR